MTNNEVEKALQEALAAEHAAVYAYGVAGAHLSGPRREHATRAWNSHRRTRDRLRRMVGRAGGSQPPAAPDYRLPRPVSDAESAVGLAATVEERVAAAYATVVAVEDTELRTFAAQAMRECAGRAARWRGSTVAFPGLPQQQPGTG